MIMNKKSKPKQSTVRKTENNDGFKSNMIHDMSIKETQLCPYPIFEYIWWTIFLEVWTCFRLMSLFFYYEQQKESQ